MVIREFLCLYYCLRFGLDVRALRLPIIVGLGVRTPGSAYCYACIVEEPVHGRRAETYTSAFVSDHMGNLLMETQGRLPCSLTGQRDSSFKCSEIKEGIS